MSSSTIYIAGDWNFCCDRCGFQYKSSVAKHEWNGLIVCPQCYEGRHPQDFVRGRIDRTGVAWVRSCCEPAFVTPDTTHELLANDVSAQSEVSSPMLFEETFEYILRTDYSYVLQTDYARIRRV